MTNGTNEKRSGAERAMLVAILAALLPACGSPGDHPAATPVSPAPVPVDLEKLAIRNVFVIVKSRHSFDNFFMAYPAGSPSRLVQSDGKTFYIDEPGSDHWTTSDDSWDASRRQYNNGAMNGFQQPEELMSGPFASMGVTPETGRRRLPYYWFLADRGVLSDHWFEFQFGPNFPNLIAVLSASSGGAVSNPAAGTFDVLNPGSNKTSRDSHFSPARIANALPVALERAGLSWSIFQENGAGVELAAAAAMIDVVSGLPDFSRRVVRSARLDQDLAGLLPQIAAGTVAFIQPGDSGNELPVTTEVPNAEKWTRSVVDAIGNSSLWPHCAIIIVWDSAGSYYDRVAPPQVDAFGMGFRVPCLIVSPFAKRGALQGAVRDHSSIARFCENNFGLSAMTARDAGADDLMSAFDFTQPPRPYSEFVPPPAPPPDPGVETFPNEGRTHVPVGTVVNYQTDPPTSGNHYPDPQPGGFYTTAIASGFLVHSMEHGGVIVYYDAAQLSQSDVDAIHAVADLHPGLQAQICAVPRVDATYPVILTAWTHRLRLTAYDGGRIQGFVNTFLGRGPE